MMLVFIIVVDQAFVSSWHPVVGCEDEPRWIHGAKARRKHRIEMFSETHYVQ